MAAGRDATAPATNTPTNGIAITVIHLPSLAPTSLGHPSSCRTDVLKRIRGSLARNIPVLVTNCLPDSTCGPIGFDAESVRALKGDLDQMTSWEGIKLLPCLSCADFEYPRCRITIGTTCSKSP
jgi:hypothetical protein